MKTRVCLKHFICDCNMLAQCNEEVVKHNASFILSTTEPCIKIKPNDQSKFKYRTQNFSFQLHGYILEKRHTMCCRLSFWNGRKQDLKNKFFISVNNKCLRYFCQETKNLDWFI